jgi:AcrR family transcriptional regulator
MPEERPRQILEAAFQTFAEHGLANAKLDDIAKRAGVSKGTIYLYFPNKEELFREVVRQTVADSIDELERSAKGHTATEDLTQYIAVQWRFMRSASFPPLYRWVLSELPAFPDLADFYGREVVTRKQVVLRGILERGVAGGEFRAMDPTVASRMLMSMLITHANWCGLRPHVDSVADRTDEQVLQEIKQFYLNAIRREPDAAATESHS